MTHKEFYFWLQGYLYGKLDDGTVNVEPIIQKMDLVKDSVKIGVSEPYKFPVPVNPFPVKDDPFKPPYEVYCGTKEQLND